MPNKISRHSIISLEEYLKKCNTSPGQVAQLVRAPSRHAKVMGSIPDQGTYKKSTNRCINKWNNKSISLSLSLFLPPLSQINKIKNIEWTESPMQSRRPKSTAIYT